MGAGRLADVCVEALRAADDTGKLFDFVLRFGYVVRNSEAVLVYHLSPSPQSQRERQFRRIRGHHKTCLSSTQLIRSDPVCGRFLAANIQDMLIPDQKA